MPAGHELGEESVFIYRESDAPQPVYEAVCGKSEAPGSLSGRPVIAAYAPLEIPQQKRLAARRHRTTYCYDFPSVFQTALHDIWAARAVHGEPGTKPTGNWTGGKSAVTDGSEIIPGPLQGPFISEQP